MACDATVALRYEKIAETEDGPEFKVISGPSLVSVIIQSSAAATAAPPPAHDSRRWARMEAGCHCPW